VRGARIARAKRSQYQQEQCKRKIYFLDCLNRADWQRQSSSAVVDAKGRTPPLAALHHDIAAAINTATAHVHHVYRLSGIYRVFIMASRMRRPSRLGPMPNSYT
jgi:hypothetical protein